MKDISPRPADRPPHPLTRALIARLRERCGARILEIGRGSGRNTDALSGVGFIVESFDHSSQPGYAAAISTHALLHGTPQTIEEQITEIAQLLEPGAPLYATFGSIRDARYGNGDRIEEHVYAPIDGDEAGVPHAFFDRERLAVVLERHFAIETLIEVDVDEIAGRWAHERAPLRDAVHWFALLRKRSNVGGVREVRASDAQRWLEMRSSLWPDAGRAELREEIDRHFAGVAPVDSVFVYEDADGTLAGMLELSLRPHADGCAGSPVPFIEAWFVTENARGCGIGKSLVRAAEYWAIARGFTEIASDTQLENARSIHAHKALGYTEIERLVLFRREL